jgi:hypothetical protein
MTNARSSAWPLQIDWSRSDFATKVLPISTPARKRSGEREISVAWAKRISRRRTIDIERE